MIINIFYDKCSNTNVFYDLLCSVSSETKRLEAFSFLEQTTWIAHLSNSCTRSERYFPSRSLTGILFNLQIYQLRSEKLGEQETRYDSTDREPEASALEISSDESPRSCGEWAKLYTSRGEEPTAFRYLLSFYNHTLFSRSSFSLLLVSSLPPRSCWNSLPRWSLPR